MQKVLVKDDGRAGGYIIVSKRQQIQTATRPHGSRAAVNGTYNIILYPEMVYIYIYKWENIGVDLSESKHPVRQLINMIMVGFRNAVKV